jgi:hypothetical protein
MAFQIFVSRYWLFGTWKGSNALEHILAILYGALEMGLSTGALYDDVNGSAAGRRITVVQSVA